MRFGENAKKKSVLLIKKGYENMDIRNDLLEMLNDCTYGRVTEVNPDDVLTSDLGLNSFELFEMICSVEDKYNILIPEKDFPKLNTVRDVVKYLEEMVKE